MQEIIRKKQEYMRKVMEGAYVPNYKLVQKKSSSVKIIQPPEKERDIQSEIESLLYGKRSSIPSQNVGKMSRNKNRSQKVFDLEHLSIQSLDKPIDHPMQKSRNNICKSAFTLPTMLNVNLPRIKVIEEEHEPYRQPIPLSKRASLGQLFT